MSWFPPHASENIVPFPAFRVAAEAALRRHRFHRLWTALARRWPTRFGTLACRRDTDKLVLQLLCSARDWGPSEMAWAEMALTRLPISVNGEPPNCNRCAFCAPAQKGPSN